MTEYCSGIRWKSCSPAEKATKLNYNLVVEETILDQSSAKYYDQLSRDPASGKPEQDLLCNLIGRTSDVMLEYIVNNKSTAEWKRPLFDLGPERLIAVVFSSLIESLYVFQATNEWPNSFVLDGTKQQDVIRKMSADVIFASKYYSAISSNRGAWVKANRILNGGWTKRNIQKFIKTHSHSEVKPIHHILAVIRPHREAVPNRVDSLLGGCCLS
jgi:hypothetical protein